MKTKSGEYRWFNSRGQVIRDENEKPVRMSGSIRDITELKESEETIKIKTHELEQSKNNLRQLTAKLERVREEEQTLIAREIHDELGQAFTALKFDVAWLQNAVRSRKKEVWQKLETMSELINTNIKTVRKISSELRPPVLDDLGLSAAIEWYCYDIKHRTNLDCELDIDTNEDCLSKDLRTTLYRVFQESLTNIARHAEANKFWVKLSSENNKIILQITDDGIGINEAIINGSACLGILGMKERIQPFGGTIDIKKIDKNRGGTQITISMPISRL